MTAMTTEGSILAVRKVWGRMRLTPTQKMSIEPTSERLLRAVVVMMGESAGKQRDRPLEHGDGQGGENAAASERRRHGADDDAVQRSLEGERGPVAEQAVLDRSHNCHGADTHGE